MLTFTRQTRTFILLLIFVYAAFSADLTEKQKSKLHPLFQSLIANSSQSLLKTPSRFNGITSTVSGDGTLRYSSIVYTRDADALRSMGIHVNSVLPEFVTAQLTPSDIVKLADHASIKFLDPGRIRRPQLDVSVRETGANLVHSGFINSTPYKGAGAIVLIYDTGIDWKHFDFRKAGDTTKSRILFIWDQTLSAITGESAPSGFSYGVEYTQADIGSEFDGTKRDFIREQDIHGHGTHVASTAAGNGQAFNNKYLGMAPEADIIVIKGGDEIFTEAKMIDGLSYAQTKAAALGKPIVVNMSLGGQTGSHDGTNPEEVAVNTFVQNPGRVVCISAGNDGANSIHCNGTITNANSTVFTFTIPAYTPNSKVDNDYVIMDIWLPDVSAVDITVRSPSNITYTQAANSSGTASTTTDGTIDVLNLVQNQNSHREIQVYVHDKTTYVPKSGTWTITLITEGSSVAYDGWIDSDLGGSSATLSNGNTNKTVGMPGTASGAITVASYVTKWSWTTYDGRNLWYGSPDRTSNISTFSSIGPTADSRQKPDIAAPGQAIVASLSSNADTTGQTAYIVPSFKYRVMQGTSMSCPHVTGGAALLLGAKPSLTADQIKNYIITTAKTDAFTSNGWNSTWGFGKMDIYKAVASAVGASGANRELLSYYSGTTTGYTPLTSSSNQKLAERFTPTISGNLSSITITINGGQNAVNGTGNLRVTATQSIAGSIDGIPGAQIGNSVLVPFSSLNAGVANTIDLSSAGISVTSGTDFHIVLETTNSGDLLYLLLDDGSLNIDRSSSYRIGATGVLGWYNRADPNYASSYTISKYNLLITADIAVPVTEVRRIGTELPTSFTLNQNYPNPFNPTTKITYAIPTASKVTLKIFNLLGQLVTTLVDERQEANIYVKEFDASRLASGTYFYQINAGSFSSTKKMILMK